jgi:hypothetical protein
MYIHLWLQIHYKPSDLKILRTGLASGTSPGLPNLHFELLVTMKEVKKISGGNEKKWWSTPKPQTQFLPV